MLGWLDLNVATSQINVPIGFTIVQSIYVFGFNSECTHVENISHC